MLATTNSSMIMLSNESPLNANENRLVIVSDGMQCVVSDSLARNFASFLPKSESVERVAWDWEGDVLRVWTIISRRDAVLQRAIYEAESRFLDIFTDRQCDFSIVYREDRDMAEILPTRAHVLSFAD